ncbi:MAG: helix-turn-helix domain-containing protein [Planctomycetaceae bacterium]|nr:helix-turn-helix domain-containing protein [Planctomycetaceae bacterium]
MTLQTNTEYVTSGISGMEFVHSTGRRVNISQHTHISTYIILLVRSGTIRVSTTDGPHCLRAKSHIALPPHCLHGIQAVTRHSLLSLCIDKCLIGRNKDQIFGFLEDLVNNGRLRRTERRLFIKALDNLTPSSGEPEDSLRLLQEEMSAAPDQDITLTEMAEHVHFDKYHLIRLFRKRYGLTPYSFLLQNRVRKARNLLSKNTTLTQTALQAGFFDQSHFIKHFKRLHGLTPRQYLNSQVYIT